MAFDFRDLLPQQLPSRGSESARGGLEAVDEPIQKGLGDRLSYAAEECRISELPPLGTAPILRRQGDFSGSPSQWPKLEFSVKGRRQ